MSEDRKAKEHKITEEVKIGREPGGRDYYLVVNGEKVKLDEIEIASLHSEIEDLLFFD